MYPMLLLCLLFSQYCRTIATRRGICTREFNEEDGFSRRTTAASSFEDPEQEIAEKHDIITSNIDDTDKTLHNTSDRPAMRCRIYDDGRVAKLQQVCFFFSFYFILNSVSFLSFKKDMSQCILSLDIFFV